MYSSDHSTHQRSVLQMLRQQRRSCLRRVCLHVQIAVESNVVVASTHLNATRLSTVWRVSQKGKVQMVRKRSDAAALVIQSEQYRKKRVHYNDNPIARSIWGARALEVTRILLATLKHIRHGTSSLKIPNPVRCV